MTENLITNSDIQDMLQTTVAEQLQLVQDPEIISWGPPGWVAVSGRTNEQEQVAVKLVHSLDPEELLDDTNTQVHTLQALASYGARVVEYLDEPWIEKRRDIPGAFVGSISRFLPNKFVTSEELGSAIGTIHNASQFVDLSKLKPADPLRTISNADRALAHVQELQAQKKMFQIGRVAMDGDHVALFERTIAEADALLAQLFALAQRSGSPLVIPLEDVKKDNAARSGQGIVKVLDVDPRVGPAALDFGRVRNDWPRFQTLDRARDSVAYEVGYRRTIFSGQLPHPYELALAEQFSDRRSSALMVTMAINAVLANHPGEEDLLAEGLHRLRVVGQPDKPWHADDAARREAVRAHRA